MIVIEASGGLGNQMFQYALYKKLEFMGKDVFFDTSFFRSKWSNRELELGVFDVQYRSILDKDVAFIRGYGYQDSLIDKMKYKMKPSKFIVYKDIIEKVQPEIMMMDNVYLSGYWQSEKYFKDIRDIILQEFSFPEEIKKRATDLCERIKEENSVSLHVRRSDYLTEQNIKLYGNICNEKYYKSAMDYMESQVNKLHYYVFTDDLQWANAYFIGDKYTIVDGNRGKDSWVDMYLMSQCKHNIIANSTFSWWGAWLNQNDNKIVVSPSKWFNTYDAQDIICNEWVRVN